MFLADCKEFNIMTCAAMGNRSKVRAKLTKVLLFWVINDIIGLFSLIELYSLIIIWTDFPQIVLNAATEPIIIKNKIFTILLCFSNEIFR